MQEIEHGAYGVFAATGSDSDDPAPARLTIAQAWTSARKARDRVIDASLFVNPAWDILLDLYINHAQHREACVTDVCFSSTAPSTTVMRWIVTLETRGLVQRAADPKDKRRTLLDLSAEGLLKMEMALDASSASDARHGIGRLRMTK